MKILVTGAAGFIGSHLSQKLAQEGHSVIGIDSLNNYYDLELKQLNVKDIIEDGVEFHHINLTDNGIENLVKDAEIIYHLAAQPGISDSTSFDDYLENNFLATKNLTDFALKSKSLKLFINVATSSIYGKQATDPEISEPKPTSFYGVTKLAAEQLVMAYSREKEFPACSLRLFSVYGPRERPEKLYPKLIHSILSDTPFPLFEGSREHLRSFTYIDDIINGFMAVLNHQGKCIGEIFNIGSDIQITTGEAIDLVEKLMCKKAKFDMKPKRTGDQLATHANIQKAKKILGYKPLTKPEDGFLAEIEWFKTKIFKR